MKPTMLFQNIIWGMYVDMEGEIVGINHKTGEKLVVQFIKQKSKTKKSRIHGFVYDKNEYPKIEIYGSWLSEITIKNLDTDETEVVWSEPNKIENADLQYNFGQMGILMNYLNTDLA